ncbi:hypothetical protein UA08_00023 [Talaromyces atroroseus]|uniref:Arp2/3 complex 41 kDa subunit n=1 Tax=Talaromyces atroroseus TaxID=1441469 RepID=A0A225BBQ6_TALAT|nr:hypothetical protein UA08_00023 [Talaromyces atroroseus]OKL64335.1 hypothetical protein UA08_00023 [Talaromyces atroroseus]
MASPEVHHLFHSPIADHSFSQDKGTLAVARESNVELYQLSGNKFALKDELRGHEKTVTGVDIAPNSGRIVTCSQDRNAYVWERTASGWKPTLVLLRINRAATFVRWSPSEQKFAVGSGARVIAVCYFEEENDWWISKHLKKPIRSTITTLAWHPNSVLLAAGSSDSHARVLSSYIKGVDERPEPSAWGERLPFNTVCGEFLNDSAGWVHGIAFSPSGNALAFASHDSSVTVVYPSAPDQPPRAMLNISTRLLPFTSLIWSGEDQIIAAGHDCEVYRLRGDENGWQLVGSLESKRSPSGGVREESALNMFRQMDLHGQTRSNTQLDTVHQNAINTLRVYEEHGGVVKKFTRTVQYNQSGDAFISKTMESIKYSLLSLLRCLAILSFATTPSIKADVILNDTLSQQRYTTNRSVSATLFAELEESARLADIAYCVGTTGIYSPFGCLSHCEEFNGFELITTWNTGPLLSDSCGYIALSHPPFAKRIILAFRGTHSLTNTIVDLSAVPQTYVPYPADGDDDNAFEGILEARKCHNCAVHAGFWTSWKNSRDTVLSAVTQAREQYPDYEVTLIGHSLGGAVAALAGLEMYARGFDPLVTTFGEPKIGNDKMAEFIDAIFSLSSPLEGPQTDGNDGGGMLMRYRRVTHVNDPVPLLPLAEWGYAPHAGEIYISKLDLPPSIADLELCTGSADSHCIAGAEGDGNEKAKMISSLASIPQQQLQLEELEMEELKAQWSFLPARYRIWELFLAHRDYFWRIGLCVPGGDPGWWRW